MPVNQLLNPLLEESENAAYAVFSHNFQYDPAGSGALLNGTLVVLETTTGTGPVLITRSTTTPSPNMLGIVINAPSGGYLPGQVVQVASEGVVQALFAATTVAGNYALSGTTTAGTLVGSATATNALTMGIILQAVTISSGTALVWVYIHRT